MESTTRRTQLEVQQDRYRKIGYEVHRKPDGYFIHPTGRPEDREDFPTLTHVRDRYKQLKANPLNDTPFKCQIAEMKIKYQPRDVEAVNGTGITSPQDAVIYLRAIFDPDTYYLQEHFYVLCLDNAKHPIGYYHVSMGGQTATIVDPAAIYRIALLSGAQSIVLAHNHPSGQTQESKSDIQLTKRIVEAGKLFGIPVEDHIILAGDTFVSFRAKGLL